MKKYKKECSKSKPWEKIFLTVSVICIFVIIGIYAYRTIYYYRKLNYIKPDSKLIDVIANEMKVVYSEDGLYKNGTTYYYKGLKADNYLYFSGRLWRIIAIDANGIKIITEENQTSLVWGNKTNYDKSYIYKWLNENIFLKSLDEPDKISDSKWCNSGIDITNYDCQEETTAKVGLITTEEYLRAGGINSYLNNKSYFWTINTSNDQLAYYIHNEGGINNNVGANDSLHSYGVRPVLYLDKDILYTTGDGSKEKPYVIDNNENINIGDHSIGSYVKYHGYTFRIMNKTEASTSLIMDGYILNEDGEPLTLTYSKVNEYLNNTFLNNLNKDDLVKIDFLKTEYNHNSNYNYLNKKGTTNTYVGIPLVGDLFTADYSGNWLNTTYNNDQKLVYTTDDFASLLADLDSSSHYLRPIIVLKNDLIISGGRGTKEDPYLVGDQDEN